QSVKQRLCLLILALLVFSQVIPAKAMEEGKERQKKTRKDEGSDKVYKKWLEAVTEIITHDELEAFNRLQTDAEREHYLENFWLRRAPDPDTPENEYRDEHFRRIAYANEHYSSGIAGSKTDRGKVYIKYGPPDSIESHPAGGPYERPF